ncbi:MAG: hypothetical protein JRF69_13635, partial [Deltaproteobacteria bacterium]|nr:hypothetical protein [Deltaproteobacteria bacterium]
FSEKLAAVMTDGKWVYINKKGKQTLNIAGTFVGYWHPPETNCTVFLGTGITIYNYTTEEFLITTAHNNEYGCTPDLYVQQLNQIVLPAYSSYHLYGAPKKYSDFQGYINFETGGPKTDANDFKIWLFTSQFHLYCPCGLMLEDSSGKKGESFYPSGLPNYTGMLDQGVRLVTADFRIYASKTWDQCRVIYDCTDQATPPPKCNCGSCISPVAIMIMPGNVPLPQPYE